MLDRLDHVAKLELTVLLVMMEHQERPAQLATLDRLVLEDRPAKLVTLVKTQWDRLVDLAGKDHVDLLDVLDQQDTTGRMGKKVGKENVGYKAHRVWMVCQERKVSADHLENLATQVATLHTVPVQLVLPD